MKSRILTCITAMTLFAALAIPIAFGEQHANPAKKAQHHHYNLIDLGTFGGPLSSINFAVDVNDRAVNRSGTTVGFSATSVLKLPQSNPIICGGDDSLGSFITHAFQWQDGTVTDLGALSPIETDCSNAYQVNADGEIAGFSENGEFDPITGTNQSRAVHWRNGKIEDLGSFGGNQNEALAINNRGQIVGFSLNAIPDPYSIFDIILNLILGTQGGTQTRAALWQDGKMEDLGTLGGNDAFAFYINDRGQVAGVSYTSTVPNPITGVPPQDPFLWENGNMVDLGSLGGAYGSISGQGGGLNNRGQVIGVSSVAANPGACFFTETDPNCHPFLWSQGHMIDLNTTTAGGKPLSAEAINDAAEIVGGADFSGTGGSAFDAYLWMNGTAVDLGDAPGDCFSAAFAINSRGQIVGNSFSCDGNFDRAFLWENASIIDLNTVIPPGSSLKLVAANAINDHGDIAGEGLPVGCSNLNSCGHAFLLIPCDDDHPNVEGCDYSMLDHFAAQSNNSAARPLVVTPQITSSPVPTVNQIRNRWIQRYRLPTQRTAPQS